ncbi:MAG TPA: FAD-dependent oxidoreductase, partial [Saprospiraceae bacterium]|nr:FAD-dependent oxidoreductase [Saprospiraceae bacterium]
INTGIGWHEARIPTIATLVPRGAYAWVTKRLMGQVGIPLITTNRINTPEKAEEILADGCADMVSMARPLLADPDFVAKARDGRSREINTCIACNQACLDHIFAKKEASCLVNPRACRETEPDTGAGIRKKVAVIGAGPAGLSCSTELARRGHEVHLFEASGETGGQFNLAKRIPGKEEFYETLRYFNVLIEKSGVHLHLNTRAGAAMLAAGGFDDIVLATGVLPRTPSIPGLDHPKVCTYLDVITGKKIPGRKVAVIGAGGIGFDTAVLLTHPAAEAADGQSFYQHEWGIDTAYRQRGGLAEPVHSPAPRQVWLLQRSKGKPGERLGKTTGWAHRLTLKYRGVQMLSEVQYLRIDDEGLHATVKGNPVLFDADHVVLCSGQEPLRDLLAPLLAAGQRVHIIGGAREAAELDAKRAIAEGLEMARGI